MDVGGEGIEGREEAWTRRGVQRQGLTAECIAVSGSFNFGRHMILHLARQMRIAHSALLPRLLPHAIQYRSFHAIHHQSFLVSYDQCTRGASEWKRRV